MQKPTQWDIHLLGVKKHNPFIKKNHPDLNLEQQNYFTFGVGTKNCTKIKDINVQSNRRDVVLKRETICVSNR